LDTKIERTKELCGLTDEEIDIVEEAVVE